MGRMESDGAAESVTVLRKSGSHSSTTLKSQAAINSAKARGLAVETNRKDQGGSNRQHAQVKSMAKLDNETEVRSPAFTKFQFAYSLSS